MWASDHPQESKKRRRRKKNLLLCLLHNKYIMTHVIGRTRRPFCQLFLLDSLLARISFTVIFLKRITRKHKSTCSSYSCNRYQFNVGFDWILLLKTNAKTFVSIALIFSASPIHKPADVNAQTTAKDCFSYRFFFQTNNLCHKLFYSFRASLLMPLMMLLSEDSPIMQSLSKLCIVTPRACVCIWKKTWW